MKPKLSRQNPTMDENLAWKMESPTPLVIDTHNLSKTYKGVEALKDLNLTVKQNSIFGFLGPNGAGKSTTIKILLGLIQPSAGQATVFGHDVHAR